MSPAGGLQRLALVSRTGAVQVVGRSDCGGRFSQEAPPGGHLAALQVWHSNATSRPRTGTFADAFTIHQVGCGVCWLPLGRWVANLHRWVGDANRNIAVSHRACELAGGGSS